MKNNIRFNAMLIFSEVCSSALKLTEINGFIKTFIEQTTKRNDYEYNSFELCQIVLPSFLMNKIHYTVTI